MNEVKRGYAELGIDCFRMLSPRHMGGDLTLGQAIFPMTAGLPRRPQEFGPSAPPGGAKSEYVNYS
jgi:hypothetical protein